MNIKYFLTVVVSIAALNLIVLKHANATTINATAITNVTASTDMGQATTFNLQNSVNGSGLSEDNPDLKGKASKDKAAPDTLQKHLPSDTDNSWFSSPDRPIGVIDFNLNSVYELSGLDYWNASGEVALNGIRSVAISTSIDGVKFTPLEGSPTQFAQASLSKNTQLPQSFSWKSVRAQYVRIQVQSNYMGKVGSASGFSEIRFRASSVPVIAGPGGGAGNIATVSGIGAAIGWLGSLFGKGTPPVTSPISQTPTATPSPTVSPTVSPTTSPTVSPTTSPTVSPTPSPTVSPTPSPTPSTPVPTPALLPGLVAMGISVVRKRRHQATVENPSDN